MKLNQIGSEKCLFWKWFRLNHYSECTVRHCYVSKHKQFNQALKKINKKIGDISIYKFRHVIRLT